jgi:hypothetical protein
MLKLNEKILAESPSVALKEESGVFELVSPLGDVLELTCAPGLELGTPRRVSFDPEKKRSDHLWVITKIAEAPSA